MKPSNTWCQHCSIGQGCNVYKHRPRVCKDFTCWWLVHPEMPEELRPDKVHAYAVGNDGDELVRVRVDTDYPDSWRESVILEYFRSRGRHVVVACGHQVNFVTAHGRETPDKLELEWVL